MAKHTQHIHIYCMPGWKALLLLFCCITSHTNTVLYNSSKILCIATTRVLENKKDKKVWKIVFQKRAERKKGGNTRRIWGRNAGSAAAKRRRGKTGKTIREYNVKKRIQ